MTHTFGTVSSVAWRICSSVASITAGAYFFSSSP